LKRKRKYNRKHHVQLDHKMDKIEKKTCYGIPKGCSREKRRWRNEKYTGGIDMRKVATELLAVASLLTGSRQNGAWFVSCNVVEAGGDSAVLRVSLVTVEPIAFDEELAVRDLNDVLVSIRGMVEGLNGSVRVLSDKGLFHGDIREVIVEVKCARMRDVLEGLDKFGFDLGRAGEKTAGQILKLAKAIMAEDYSFTELEKAARGMSSSVGLMVANMQRAKHLAEVLLGDLGGNRVSPEGVLNNIVNELDSAIHRAQRMAARV
jgi:hypothetical protein